MGILGKMFRRKKDELDIDELAGQEAGEVPPLDELDEPLPGLEEKPLFPDEGGLEHLEKPFGSKIVPSAGSRERELELISSKLDTIKALLTSLDQRVANLERAVAVEKKERLW